MRHALALLAMVSGCRCGEPERSPSKATVPTTPTIAQCDYLTEGEASRILALTMRYRDRSPDAAACELASPEGVRIVLQVSTDTAAYDFAVANGGTPVAHLGDGAAWLDEASRIVGTVRGRDAGVSLLAPPSYQTRMDTREKAAQLLAIVLARM
jgi:hypothetical protein